MIDPEPLLWCSVFENLNFRSQVPGPWYSSLMLCPVLNTAVGDHKTVALAGASCYVTAPNGYGLLIPLSVQLN